MSVSESLPIEPAAARALAGPRWGLPTVPAVMPAREGTALPYVTAADVLAGEAAQRLPAYRPP